MANEKLTCDKLTRLTGDKIVQLSDKEESSKLGRSVFELSFQISSNVEAIIVFSKLVDCLC